MSSGRLLHAEVDGVRLAALRTAKAPGHWLGPMQGSSEGEMMGINARRISLFRMSIAAKVEAFWEPRKFLVLRTRPRRDAP